MRTLGIIGAGKMGSALARLAVRSGTNIVIANSRGPESLERLSAELGPSARSAGLTEAAAADWAVVLAIPMLAISTLPTAELDGQVVIDVSNYYPIRDGRVAELDAETMTEAQLTASWLPGSRYVKAFSNVFAHHLPQLARPAAATDRTSIPVASDDRSAARVAFAVVDALGFDPLDAGGLADTWRFEPEAGAFTQIYLADQNPEQLLESALAPGAPVSGETLRRALTATDRVTVADRVF